MPYSETVYLAAYCATTGIATGLLTKAPAPPSLRISVSSHQAQVQHHFEQANRPGSSVAWITSAYCPPAMELGELLRRRGWGAPTGYCVPVDNVRLIAAGQNRKPKPVAKKILARRLARDIRRHKAVAMLAAPSANRMPSW